MSWSPVISSENVVAIHAILVRTLNGDGEIIMIGGDNHSYKGNNPSNPHDYDHSRRFNCRTTGMIADRIITPDFDLFCCGHAFLGDGRLLLAGGTKEFPADAGGIHHHLHFEGHRHSAIYNYLTATLIQASDMNPEPGFNTGGGRWYPSLCTLGNGDVFAFQGHPQGDDNRHGNPTPERYQLASGSWILLPAIGTITGDPILYPRMHVLNDGRIFVSSAINGYSHNIKINPYNGSVDETTPLPDGQYWGFDCPSVLLSLSPSDGYAAHILLCGGEKSQIINLGEPNPNWITVTRDGQPTGPARIHSCATLLPTGQVVLTGGAQATDDQVAINFPEVYNPITRTWSKIINNDATVKRNYHSSALLMPDGRIWTGGGNSPKQPYEDGPTPEQEKIEIYTPPYPAGTRPKILTCPLSVSYGQKINIETDNASIIAKVVLMRCGTSTHAYNPDQRAINLDFDSNGNTIFATIPTNPNVAVPGQYMLFTIDNAGRPCQYAKFIRVAFQSSEIITDRSTFSVLEVDASLTAGNALFQRAFYVVFDGFIPSELSNFTTAPTINFKFSSGGIVPSMLAELADIEYEDPSRPLEIPQKVTFIFDVKFTNNSAFGFTDPTRDVVITAALGQNIANAIINFTKAPNPYMVDGPTSWLSVDLRVFQLKQGQVKASIPQGASGNDFINLLLDKFNILPDNDYHPFKSITIDQEDSKLELSETVGGVTVFNYAIAKVRYKAPVPTLPPPDANDAHDVKVFFRLFNTTGTPMNYNPFTTYKRAGTGAGAISLIGMEGGAITSLPFFAAPRVNYPTVSMATQTDNKNKKTIIAKNNVESVAYFGCWLDINRDGNKLFPLNPANDGPFPSGDRKSILELIRGVHQCLVAEVYFEGDPTPFNATPASSDNLSQRNLAIVASDNPGNQATHTVQHTFEIKPSSFKIQPNVNNALESINKFVLTEVSIANQEKTGPDFLLIHWYNLPKASKITLYMPDIKVDEILALEPYTRFSPTNINKEDEYTFSFLAADVSYVPIPGGFVKNIPGLITIELPSTVVKGQLFKIVVQQARYYRNSRRIIGSFQVNIPVTTAALMLPSEMRNLAVLKHIHNSIPVTDSWYKIFNKYLKGLSDKLDGLGGDATNVPASPNDKWMDDETSDYKHPDIPNNISQIVDDLRNITKCISKSSEKINCIKVKKITIDIHFKDEDCC